MPGASAIVVAGGMIAGVGCWLEAGRAPSSRPVDAAAPRSGGRAPSLSAELLLRAANCPSEGEIWCSEGEICLPEGHSSPSEREISSAEGEISRCEHQISRSEGHRSRSKTQCCLSEREICRSERHRCLLEGQIGPGQGRCRGRRRVTPPAFKDSRRESWPVQRGLNGPGWRPGPGGRPAPPSRRRGPGSASTGRPRSWRRRGRWPSRRP